MIEVIFLLYNNTTYNFITKSVAMIAIPFLPNYDAYMYIHIHIYTYMYSVIHEKEEEGAYTGGGGGRRR